MRFIVRYWSSLIPDGVNAADGTPCWVDYSAHPASKLGLHNALLAVHDRLEILGAHGGRWGCAVFVVDCEQAEQLTEDVANALFARLPRGEVKWLDIKEFLLPGQHFESPTAGSGDLTAQQLPLFEHLSTPYDPTLTPPGNTPLGKPHSTRLLAKRPKWVCI